MLKFIGGHSMPPSLRGPILVDQNGLPRFWVSVWSLYAFSDLASSSVTKQLGYVESLYQFADQLEGVGFLDDAIARVDLGSLGRILEAFFVSIRNQSTIPESAEIKWRTAFGFVRETVLRLSKSNLPLDQINEIEVRLNRLNLLYQQLRVGRRRTQEILRSLPAGVVEALYHTLDPSSSTNPFVNDGARWRAFVIFVVLLHQGLRRGELLSLPADGIKTGFDTKLGKERCWLSVTENPYEDEDSRYSKPSIKTVASIRQMPVSELTANIVREYIENYRGRPEHSFLINSQRDTPFSAESVTKLFQKISSFLPQSALKELQQKTGKTSVSAHDLRHTCAVVRLNQLLNQGDTMDEALQKMRTFFGWSRSSDMPRKYARAVFEDRLAEVWNNVFDDRVAILRAIPGGAK